MKQLGVRVLRREEQKILTAREVRNRLETGQPLTGRLTPLAQDLLEAKEKETWRKLGKSKTSTLTKKSGQIPVRTTKQKKGKNRLTDHGESAIV